MCPFAAQAPVKQVEFQALILFLFRRVDQLRFEALLPPAGNTYFFFTSMFVFSNRICNYLKKQVEKWHNMLRYVALQCITLHYSMKCYVTLRYYVRFRIVTYVTL